MTVPFRSLVALIALSASATLWPALAAEDVSARLDRLEAQATRASQALQVAQGYGGYGKPPGDVGDGAQTQEDASMSLRLDRLEAQMRQMTGQIEQMQFAARRLEDQMKKFQQDVEFRFQEGAGHSPARPQKRTDLQDASPPVADASGTGLPATTTPGRVSRRNDAFDPNRDSSAPGAPRTLGGPAAAPSVAAVPEGAPIALDPNDSDAPLDLSGARARPTTAPRPPVATPPRAATSGPVTTPGGTIIAAATPETPKEDFDVAVGYFKDKQYESAEKGFAGFLQKNPKNRLAPDAIYYLGESYFLRNRPADAAQQFLKISTDYASSPRAPEAMLRLGQSLHALGAKEQACATFSEIGRKYPNASASVRSGAEREAKRSQC